MLRRRSLALTLVLLAGALTIAGTPATPAGAEVSAFRDATGDAPDPLVDVTAVSGEDGRDLLTLSVRVVRGEEPSTSDAWRSGRLRIEARVSADGGTTRSTTAIAHWSPTIERMLVSSFGSDGWGCPDRGFASFDGKQTYTVLVPRSCLREVTPIRYGVSVIFEPDGVGAGRVLSDDAPDADGYGGPSIGRAATNGNGYWLVASDGGIFTQGEAQFFGSTGGMTLNQPIVGMAPTPTGLGYWLVASDGGIFSYGDAGFFGSTGDLRLNRPIVGIAATPTGRGYSLVASDGGIFSFGDARFLGSTGDIRLAQPIVGMAMTRSGGGYWLVAADGGVFTFGDAPYLGSAAERPRTGPVVGMSTLPNDNGYRLLERDGNVHAFGDATFEGRPNGWRAPAVGITNGARDGRGYWLAAADAQTYSAWGGVWPTPSSLNRPIVGIARTP